MKVQSTVIQAGASELTPFNHGVPTDPAVIAEHYLESLPVILHQKIEIECDSCLIENVLYDRRLNCGMPPAFTAFSEATRLLRAFLKAAAQAPEGTESIEFLHDHWSLAHGVYLKKSWTCKVYATLDNGVRRLTFTDTTPEKTEGELI